MKVLDFGLAKTVERADAMLDSPTLTVGASEAGVILGTAAYMSPEQACGKTVDKRTDIWAFGCVLYEILTGKRAFSGEDGHRCARGRHEKRAGLERVAVRCAGTASPGATPLSPEGIRRRGSVTSATRASKSSKR